jgi:hypothetical protein
MGAGHFILGASSHRFFEGELASRRCSWMPNEFELNANGSFNSLKLD